MVIKYIRNSDINRVLIGTPKDHKHMRVIIDLKNGDKIIFSEATIANIARAYITIKTHPKISSLELVMKDMKKEDIKEGFSQFQLIETNSDEKIISEEISNILEKSEFL